MNCKLEYIERQLSELQLIYWSLLPDEHFLLLDSAGCGSVIGDFDDIGRDSGFPFWKRALESYAEYELPAFLESVDLDAAVISPASFELKVDGANTWFQVTLPPIKVSDPSEEDSYEPAVSVDISVKGENITRAEQENWQAVIVSKMKEIDRSEKLFWNSFERIYRYQHNSVIYHVLFTSHHLISPTKRRSLQHWSSSLSLYGFAKVGYPGVIYAEGERSDIEGFVDNVKGMQWLGLKLRFVEPLDVMEDSKGMERRWTEFQKVGEVIEEMRRIGREKYVVEMGIGSLGAS